MLMLLNFILIGIWWCYKGVSKMYKIFLVSLIFHSHSVFVVYYINRMSVFRVKRIIMKSIFVVKQYHYLISYHICAIYFRDTWIQTLPQAWILLHKATSSVLYHDILINLIPRLIGRLSQEWLLNQLYLTYAVNSPCTSFVIICWLILCVLWR